MSDFKTYINQLANGNDLTLDQSKSAFEAIMSGETTEAQIAAFLMGLRMKGESIDEISGAVSIMRSKVTPVEAPGHAIDIVGTGGDGLGTYNISTTTALIVAACGQPVAKHGNKQLSSLSGTADVFSNLGLDLNLDPNGIATCIKETNIGFMFAPNHHSAMRFVGPTRTQMGTRTIFNILGPLSNPANVKNYMIGVFSPHLVEPLANVLLGLGAENAWVVHGEGGMDEISTLGVTHVAEVKEGDVHRFEIHPADFDLPVAHLDDLVGGTPEFNAKALKSLLNGQTGAYRDIVLMNSAAALYITGHAKDYKEGTAIASDAIDTGKANATLEQLIETSAKISKTMSLS